MVPPLSEDLILVERFNPHIYGPKDDVRSSGVPIGDDYVRKIDDSGINAQDGEIVVQVPEGRHHCVACIEVKVRVGVKATSSGNDFGGSASLHVLVSDRPRLR